MTSDLHPSVLFYSDAEMQTVLDMQPCPGDLGYSFIPSGSVISGTIVLGLHLSMTCAVQWKSTIVSLRFGAGGERALM